jgi:CHU_C Type IX secretion signal domain
MSSFYPCCDLLYLTSWGDGMKWILLAALWVLVFPAMASHIVGGEFELIHLSDNNYRINMILYFDELNGLPGARDPNVVARIYRKRDNFLMRDVYLPVVSDSPVNYTQPECSHGEVVTSRIVYSDVFLLPAGVYDDPDGYYLVWERCCRNYSITNIRSDDPTIGTFAGQTFYLEFPPVSKGGQPFIDSTPRLFPPLNDYACPFRPYYVDFAGTDDDGDSLVYTLVTPLNTKSSAPIPFPGPGTRPYPEVQWRPPFSLDNIMNGSPDLKITQDGFITVTPITQGLFVFAVKCEEFRDNIKIGEVRRDFQMLVVDRCPHAEPPQILGKKLSDSGYIYDGTMNVSFTNKAIDEERCIQVQVSDPDASKPEENYQERISIRAIPLGFKKDVNEILPVVTNSTLINGSTRVFDICFPECPYVPGPYTVGILAFDDACTLPLYDTLKVTVDVQPPPNANPYFTTPDVTAVLNEGDTQSWAIQAKDDDGDPLVIGFVPIGFVPELAGMKFTITDQQDGLVNAQLVWDAYCNIYDFTQRTDFEVMVVAEDVDQCNIHNAAVMRLKLKVILPENHLPVIDTDLTPDPAERYVTGIKRQIYESLRFNVTGRDGDNDLLVLGMEGVGFDVKDYDITFEPASAHGFVTSQFRWDIGCDKIDLDKRDVFDFRFVVVDEANKCQFVNTDTVDVIVQLEKPPNSAPTLSYNSLHEEQRFIDGNLTADLGQQIDIDLLGTDPDNIPDSDLLRLELIGASGTVAPEGYIFAPAEGKGSVESTFSWNPDCSIFSNGVYENQYEFSFRVYDSRCFNVKGDTVVLDITIRDVDSDLTIFNPANIITPNGDDCNDYFAMEGLDAVSNSPCATEDPDGIVRLPKDNCIRKFEAIRIYNRWGTEVFESTHRDFRWYATDQPNGVYYYSLLYSDREYKGSVTVRY